MWQTWHVVKSSNVVINVEFCVAEVENRLLKTQGSVSRTIGTAVQIHKFKITITQP